MVVHESQPMLLTVAETARLLRISRNLAYDLIAQDKLPHVRLGRRILVPRARIARWIEDEAGVAARFSAPEEPPHRH